MAGWAGGRGGALLPNGAGGDRRKKVECRPRPVVLPPVYCVRRAALPLSGPREYTIPSGGVIENSPFQRGQARTSRFRTVDVAAPARRKEYVPVCLSACLLPAPHSAQV